MEWKPIETAPKDGKEIIVFADGCVETAWWDDGLDDEGTPCEEPGWVWYNKSETGYLSVVTLWMPFPEPPND